MVRLESDGTGLQRFVAAMTSVFEITYLSDRNCGLRDRRFVFGAALGRTQDDKRKGIQGWYAGGVGAVDDVDVIDGPVSRLAWSRLQPDPGAALGIPFKNTFSILPKTLLVGWSGQYIVLDDATDPTNAVKFCSKAGS